MKMCESALTPEQITTASLENLVDLWEATEAASNSPGLFIVRGWLMDELERHNPDGFNAWLEQDVPEDSNLRMYMIG